MSFEQELYRNISYLNGRIAAKDVEIKELRKKIALLEATETKVFACSFLQDNLPIVRMEGN